MHNLWHIFRHVIWLITLFYGLLLLELNLSVLVQEERDGSRAPVEQKRVKSRSQKDTKSKGLAKRQSLAGFYFSFSHPLFSGSLFVVFMLFSIFPAAGTSWTSGIRRSTRIRTRPLEYWKGERLVYGRIHQSKSNHNLFE